MTKLVHFTIQRSRMSNTARGTLACGAVAGPLFAMVGLAQAFSRAGFDLNQHTLSLLSNGDLGWIQIANFVVSGALFVAAATGMRQVVTSGRAAMWWPRLIAVFGVGTVAAGALVPDPAYGFPPGTPGSTPTSVSWHGALHSFVVAALLGFLWVSALAARLRAEAGTPTPLRSPRSTSSRQASAPAAG